MIDYVAPTIPLITTLRLPANNSKDLESSVSLSWSPVAGTDYYHVQVATDSSFTHLVFDDSLVQVISKTATLSSNTQYYWHVQSRNITGTGNWSTTYNFKTKSVNLPPSKPVITSPMNNYVLRADTLKIIFSKSIDPEGVPVTYTIHLFKTNYDSTFTIADTATKIPRNKFEDKQTYGLAVGAGDGQNITWSDTSYFSIDNSTGVDNKVNNIQEGFKLEQNYPNPFNPTTTIQYSIPKREHVHIQVYDIIGRMIDNLVDMDLPAGNYKVTFPDQGHYQNMLPSGVYLYRIQAGEDFAVKKFIIMK